MNFTVKLQITKDQEKVSQVAINKKDIISKRTKIRLTDDFSLETKEAGK